MPALALQSDIIAAHRGSIINRLSSGERLQSIADDIGVNRVRISQLLTADPEFQVARTESLDARLDRAEADLEACEDMFTLARSKEILSHARWRAERLNQAVYALKPANLQVAVGVQVASGMSDAQLADIARQGVANRTIEAGKSPKTRVYTAKPAKTISKATK